MNTINSIITILLFLFIENTLAQNNSSFDIMNGTVPWLNYEILTDCHDPTIIKDDRGIYTMLSTNNMLRVRQSEDMKNWTNQGRIISSLPSWIANVNTETVDIWAPYIYYRDGKYWCYYSISSWGTNNSGIGLLTNTTLDPSSPNYMWEDKGMVFRSYTNNNYNAIDPEVIEDNGKLWMVFGSYWTGIKMIELDIETGLQNSANTSIYSLASRNGAAIEGPSIIKHNNEFFLFTAWDACCDGIQSTYRTMVSKASSITGTYLSKNGTSLMNNASEELLSHYGRYYGPGGGAAVRFENRHYFVHHYYNASQNGAPRMQIREIVWDDNNWPIITQPFLGRRLAYEAEHAQISNAQILSATGTISGGEYVGYINEDDSRLQFHINALQAGEYKLMIRYAAGLGNASHFISINNEEIEVNYPATSEWGSFPEQQTVFTDIVLRKGYNNISFRKGTGFAELDRFDLIRYAKNQIEAGSYDNSNSAEYIETNNSVILNEGKWIHFENIHFEDGGFTNVSFLFADDCNAEIRISLNQPNGEIQQTININSTSGEELSTTLNSAFAQASGIYDLYISVISGSECYMQNIQFSKTTQTDCNGVENGEAYIDACGNCVGGNTSIEPCRIIEFEDICNFDGNIENNHAGYSGQGFVNITNSLGSSANLFLQAQISANETITIKYANGSQFNRPVYLLVNDSVIHNSLDFYTTDTWDNWQYLTTQIPIQAGINKLQIVSQTNEGGSNFDAIFTSSNLSHIHCVQQTINLNSGWNLVSFYLEPYSNKTNDLIFGTSIEIIKNEHQYWNSNQNDIFNSLNRIKVGNGYMIYAQNEETIQINGIPINETTQQLELSDGWNIVGTIEEISFIDYIQTTNCIIIKDYNNYFSINESSPNFTHFEIGKAYFIKK